MNQISKVKHLVKTIISSHWAWAMLLLLATVGFYPFTKYIIGIKKTSEILDAYVILGTLISGAAFIGFLHATKLQRKQLEQQTDAIRLQQEDIKVQQELLNQSIRESKEQNQTISIQRFENTLFKLIETIRSEMTLASYYQFNEHRIGRQAFISVYKDQNFVWKSCHVGTRRYEKINNTSQRVTQEYENQWFNTYMEFSKFLKKDFFDYNQAYFETIVTTLALIKRNNEMMNNCPNEYHRILLAQLSIYEKWSLLLYVDRHAAPQIRRYLQETRFFSDLTSSNFEDPKILYDFNTLD